MYGECGGYFQSVSSRLAGSDQAHLVDLVGVATTGQVVDGSVQTLQDGAVSCITTQTLSNLIADVAGLDAGEDEGIGLTSHLAALALDLCNFGSNGSVKLQLTVHSQLGIHFLSLDHSVMAQSNGAALAGALGGEAQHSNLRIDAEQLCGLSSLDSNLSNLCRSGDLDLAGSLINEIGRASCRERV